MKKILMIKKILKIIKKIKPVICYYTIRDIPEDGKLIESINGDEKFIKELKNSENNLKKLMEIKYFIDKDFKKLHEKFNEVINSNIKK